jgi:hypothetical protein
MLPDGNIVDSLEFLSIGSAWQKARKRVRIHDLKHTLEKVCVNDSRKSHAVI